MGWLLGIIGAVIAGVILYFIREWWEKRRDRIAEERRPKPPPPETATPEPPAPPVNLSGSGDGDDDEDDRKWTRHE